MRLRHDEVRYLGHLILGDGLKADPEKVATIMKMQKPTDIKSMRLFIGFVNYQNSSFIFQQFVNHCVNYHGKMQLGRDNQSKKQHSKR